MSMYAEASTDEQLAGSSMIDELLHTEDPNRQIIMLPCLNQDELIRFAKEDNASGTLLPRLMALEVALKNGFGQEIVDLSSNNEEILQTVIMAKEAYGYDPKFKQAYAWRTPVYALQKKENITEELVFPDHHMYGGEPLGMLDNNPVRALIFLDEVIDTKRGSELGDKLQELSVTFLPLSQALHDKMCTYFGLEGLPIQKLADWRDIGVCVDLLGYGEHYGDKLTELLNLETEEAMSYVRLIGSLQQRASWVSNVFSQDFKNGAEKGIQNLLADALYAVSNHMSAGRKTDTEIGLMSGHSLQLKLAGKEPMELLEAMAECFNVLWPLARIKQDHYMVGAGKGQYSGIRTIPVMKSDQAALYRLIDGDGGTKASVYIRSRGATSYDPNMEYGRNGEGVEASISYVIDPYLSKGELLEVGKHRRPGPDNRISIRLDREGIAPDSRGDKDASRDPTKVTGTLSLDVGSVIGNDEWLGTKLGRFLAWGNILRNQSQGGQASLNHVTEYFHLDAGDANIFAIVAKGLAEDFDARALSKEEIAELFGGKLGVASQLQQGK